MRLLLINPRFPESWWSSQWALDILPGKSALNPPLGLATLSALCPSLRHYLFRGNLTISSNVGSGTVVRASASCAATCAWAATSS